MAKFQINYNHRRVKGKIGKIIIDLDPEQNDLNNLYDALEEEGLTVLEIENDIVLGIKNLENGKFYRLKASGLGLE